jgi:hypothetical protein
MKLASYVWKQENNQGVLRYFKICNITKRQQENGQDEENQQISAVPGVKRKTN